ncbi:MAG: lipoate--protein ligase [Spirochaetales bacterium]|nr:lipoate--protein ligase [Spirochaetales bacterium]
MIDSILFLKGAGNDIYGNLALEQYLAQNVRKNQLILFLWQNRSCVVIGRNQNAFKECRTDVLAEEGVTLSRRLSGGGAVYQDLGNLNFTFCSYDADSDIPRQQKVILEACRFLGINARVSGRNDILAGDFKFSGNSFYSHNGRCFHNGTILLDVDLRKMEKCLNPSKMKLASKAVDSVRSRVVNLKELRPDITCSLMSDAIEKAFPMVYNLGLKHIMQDTFNQKDIEEKRRFFASYEWVYGRNADFPVSFQRRFSWGEISVSIEITGGLVSDAKVFTDALDFSLAQKAEDALKGSRFDKTELCSKIKKAQVPYAEDICTMLQEEIG